MYPWRWLVPVAAVLSVAMAGRGAQPEPAGSRTLLHEHPAVGYDASAVLPPLAEAARTLAGAAGRYDSRHGHLASVLEALDISPASQVLLFSKTGVQQALTSPQNPRAFYFNDRAVVGHVPGASFLEVAMHEPRGGAHFYTVPQERGAPPSFAPAHECLRCHVSVNTLEVPGFIARSMVTGGDGRPHPDLGSYLVDHRRDYAQRWGGWLVTGAPETLRHLGNTIATRPDRAPEASASDVPTLEGRVPTERYLTPYSDVTALAVFDHQMHAMNLLTRLAWEARVAEADGAVDLVRGALADRVRETADYLLFVDEAPLDGPITGGAGFAEWFERRGPHDARGRTLRAFDRRTRLFRYPASYMVYSPAFDALPAAVRTAVLGRMRAALGGDDGAARDGRFTADERQAALQILQATVRGF